MNQQQGVILAGAAALVFFLHKQANPSHPSASLPTPKGLTITETEALGYVVANKMAYPSLGVLPESVVMGTIAVESNFDPNAVAPAGERGLMQVIYPSTWNDVLKRAKLPDDLDSFNAKDNILVGMHYLRLVRQEFLRDGFINGQDPNDWALIDQGYNLGPAGVKAGKRNQPRIGKFLLAREKFQRAGLP
jgi:soluble lytic murein transglycosylase-like protein